MSQRAALLQPLQCVALVPTTHVCLPPTPTPDQLLHNFKKALELNGRPDVYAPLTEMAALTVKWMEVGHRGGAGRAARGRGRRREGRAGGERRHGGVGGGSSTGAARVSRPAASPVLIACTPLTPPPIHTPMQAKNSIAVQHMGQAQQQQQQRGGGYRQGAAAAAAARFQEPYERLFPGQEVGGWGGRWVGGGGWAGGSGLGACEVPGLARPGSVCWRR